MSDVKEIQCTGFIDHSTKYQSAFVKIDILIVDLYTDVFIFGINIYQHLHTQMIKVIDSDVQNL